MRSSRSFRATLVLVFVAALGGFGPALDGIAGLASFQLPPSMDTLLDFDTQTFRLSARNGMPGGAGAFNFLVVDGPTPGSIYSVSFTFSSGGEGELIIPISALNSGVNLAVGIQLVALGQDGLVYASPLWALGSHYYLVTDPQVSPCDNCPTEAGGWVEYVSWPATTGAPLYPYSTVAIEVGEERSSGQPMLALESGPAGSFPIN